MTRIKVLSAISYTHIVVFLVLLGSMAYALVAQGMPALFPFIQEDLGVNRAELGLITSGIIMGGSVTLLFMGWLADTMGVRRVLPVGMMGMAVGILLFSQIQSLVQGVLLALFISALGSASGPPSVKAIMDWVSPRTRGVSMGIKETSVPISGFLGAALFPFLAVTFSWRTAVIILGLFIAALSIVFFAFYRDKPVSGTEGTRSGLITSIALLARNRDNWLVGLGTASLLALHFVFVSYLILFLKDDFGMSPRRAAGFLAIAFIGSAVGRVSWGLISDLIGGRRVVVLEFVSILSLLSMVSMTWLPLDASPLVVGALVFVAGTSTLGWAGLPAIIVAEKVGPRLAATGFGFIYVISLLGAFGPPLFGLVVDRTGSYDTGWWIMAGVAGIGILLLAFMRPQPTYQSAPPTTISD